MNSAVVKTQHIMQAVDWSKYDLQDWLKQFGLWQNTISSGKGTENPIFQAMKKAKLKISNKDRVKLIAYYMCDENFNEAPSRSRLACEVSDDEARAVQKLVLDVINGTDSEVMLEWMDAIICRYFKMFSWSEMETKTRTVMDAKYDVRCGLAALHMKYSFIEITAGKI